VNRLERLTAILIQLQSKRIVKAQEIADRFEISLRTVYRDVKALEEAGVPLIGEAGLGYSLVEGYRLPPVMFSREEATAFLMAEKILEKYADAQSFQKYQSALYKIKAVLRASEKSFLEKIDTHLAVVKRSSPPAKDIETPDLQVFLEAIVEKKVLGISYQKADDSVDAPRYVEPVGVYLQNNYWYCIAFCRLRNDYRNFRLDRVKSMESTTTFFQKNHPTLKEYLNALAADSELFKIVIRVNKAQVRYLDNQKYYFGLVSEEPKGDQIEMTFLTNADEGFARWFMMLSGNATIIEPAYVKERVKHLAKVLYESS
jgi:predicted DNA-binding transcriptional regulator YafY